METKCTYCDKVIVDGEETVSFPFSEDQAIYYHKNCFDQYKKDFKLIRKTVDYLNSGKYTEILNADTDTDIQPITVPDQEDDNCLCPICLYNVADMVVLPCTHRICKECLLDWRRKTLTKKQQGTKCCFCRRIIQKSMPYADYIKEHKEKQ